MGVGRTLWVTRHGMRLDFVYPQWRSHAERPHDTPLSTEGFHQARETGLRLREEALTAIYASPFLRTVQTASAIADILRIPIHIEHGLGEALRSEWFPEAPDYLPPAALQKEYPAVDPGYRPLVEPAYPEDDYAITLARCRQTVQAIVERTQGNLLLVGHGISVEGAIRGLTSATEGFDCRMCALNKIVQVPEGWRLVYSGTEHLSWREEELRFY